MPFAARQGFFSGGGGVKQWYEYSNTEILSEITNWQSAGNITTSAYTSLSGIQTVNTGFWPGVLHPNGNIYYAPFAANSNNILAFNPAANTITQIATGITFSGTNKFGVGCLGKDNKIYFMPYNYNRVLVVDPDNNHNCVAHNWGLTLGPYDTCVYAQEENKIFALGGASTCLIINLTANTAVNSNLGGVISGTTLNKYVAGTYMLANKKIVFGPYNTTNMLFIDPVTEIGNTQTFGTTFGSQAIQGVTNAADGNVYLTPANQVNTYRYNPVANTLTRISTTGITSGGAAKMINDGNLVVANFVTANNYAGGFVNIRAGTVTSNPAFLTPATRRGQWILHPDGYSYTLSLASAIPFIHRTRANGTGASSTILSSIALSGYFNNK